MNVTGTCIAALNCFAIAALTDNGWMALMGFSCLLAAIVVTVADVVTAKR